MKTIEIESFDLEEAYKQAEETLKATKDQIEFKVKEEKKLTSTIYHVTATLKVDRPMNGLKYLEIVLNSLNINAMIEMRKKVTSDHTIEVKYVITSEENPILIGKGGKTLEAIQILLRNVVNAGAEEEEQYKVSVDCGGYKESRAKRLEILATKTAKEVAQSKVEAHLEPMNSFERRIVHAKLADWRDVYTESEGDGKDRHIVIKPKKKNAPKKEVKEEKQLDIE